MSFAIATALASGVPVVAKTQTITGVVSGPVNVVAGNPFSITGAGVVSGGSTGVVVNAGVSTGTLTSSGVVSARTVGIANHGGIASLVNNGVVRAGTYIAGSYVASSTVSLGIHNLGAIGALINNGTLSGALGIANDGTINALTNNGMIDGMGGGLGSTGAIGTLTNLGTIRGGGAGIGSNGAIGTLDNRGLIVGGGTGVHNSGTIGLLSNSGTISGSSHGMYEDGTIGTLTNSGAIVGGSAGLYVGGGIGILDNASIISAGTSQGVGVANRGGIGALVNSGTILGGGVGIASDGAIGTLGNQGFVSGGATGIYNGGTIGSLINGGTISGGVGLASSGTIATLDNRGAISGGATGIYNGGTIGSLSNSGAISGGVGLASSGTIATLDNRGVVYGSATGIHNSGTIGSLSNGGTISGGGVGIASSGTIATLDNRGVVYGGATGIHNIGTIGSLNNSGTISGSAYAIRNEVSGAIGPIATSGVIVGNILNDSSRDLTINGGTGQLFGTLTGYTGGTPGTITNTSSNVVLGSGNLMLDDAVNVGANTVDNAGATLQVNHAVSIAGNYTQGANAVLLVGVSGAAVTTGAIGDTGYGRLVVSGSAVIAAGSSVGLKGQGYAFAPGQRFDVVDASRAGTNYHEGSLHYSANGFNGTITGKNVISGARSDLVLTLSAAAIPPPPPQTQQTLTQQTQQTQTQTQQTQSTQTQSTPTQTSPSIRATAPNSIAALAALFRYSGYDANLMNLQNAAIAVNAYGSTEEVNHAGAQLTPFLPSAGSQAAAAATFEALDIVDTRADSLRLAQSSGSGVATGNIAPKWGVWGQAFGGHAQQGTVDQIDGYSANFGGLMIGADKAIGDHWLAGGAFSYSNTLIDGTTDSTGDSARVNGYGLIGYASYTGSPWYVTLNGGVIQQQFDTTRQVDLPGFSSVADGQFSGQQYVASAEAGWPLALGSFTLTPLGRLTYSYQHQNGYTESGGGGAALSVDAAHDTSVRSALGAKLERGFETAFGTVVPGLQAKWVHEYDHSRQSAVANFAADPSGETAFTTVGEAPVPDLADVSLSLTVLRSNNLTLTARYEQQAAPHFASETGSLRLRMLY